MEQAIFFFFNADLAGPVLDAFFGLLSSKYFFAFPLLLILLAVLYRRFATSGFLVWGVLLLAIGIGDGLGNIIKHATEVPRPCQEMKSDVRLVDSPFKYKCAVNPNGMPSNHTLNYFLLAVLFAMIMQSWRWGISLVVLAVLVGLSRMYLGMHYPSQVLVGAVLGSSFGFAFGVLVRRLKMFQHLPFSTNKS